MRLQNHAIMLSDELAKSGYQCKIISSEHIRDLEKEIEGQHSQGFFDEEFYKEELGGFDFMSADRLAGSKSLIIVAAAQPRVRVTFKRQGESKDLIIPPTYSYKTDRHIQDLLEHQLNPAGFHLQKANLPWKLLAVHSGLAQYGKNNITYVNGMGSYHRLVAFISDLPVTRDHWHALKVLERCENCNACMNACPSGAITADRFLLKAERCLTFYNERRGEFPQWIKPSWHKCLVGCLQCQRACPVNKEIPQPVEDGPVFTEIETAAILQSDPQVEVPQNAIQKLQDQDMAEYLPVLGRNMAAMFQ